MPLATESIIARNYHVRILLALLEGETHVSDLSRRTGTQTGNIRSALEELEADGLLVSKKVQNRNVVSLTEAGTLHALTIAAQKAIPAHLGSDETTLLLGEYKRIFSFTGRLAKKGLFSEKAVEKARTLESNSRRLREMVRSITPGVHFTPQQLHEEYVSLRPYDGLKPGNVSTYLNRYRTSKNGLFIKGLKKTRNGEYVIERSTKEQLVTCSE